MSSAREIFKTLLKANGQSVTRARLSVFGALLGQEPLAMHELVTRVEQVDRASVYRAIDLFEHLGIVQRLNTGWKYKLELTDKFAEHHHHLTCTDCGRTIPMNEVELEDLITKLAVAHQFKPLAHQIELQGICAQCQTK
ncbi:MAG TPA: Fur family transcriptional regulator [Patescibacteria group bacterium]|nr:Fur family transcriptional regulator [Patescibacteria group bacterium]